MASYIRGRLNIACCNLLDELRCVGIRAAVGHSGRGAKAVLTIVPHEKIDESKIPKIYDGIPVVVDYDAYNNLVQRVNSGALTPALNPAAIRGLR